MMGDTWWKQGNFVRDETEKPNIKRCEVDAY